jgi:CheY-like chemotaxis protein
MRPTRRLSVEHHRPSRILVADPDSDTRLLYRDVLQSDGSDVVDAIDGRDAMMKALSVRPTLVITELRLPLFDSFALCDVLRRDSLTKTVPIVVVTAKSRPAEVERARAAGDDLVLTKPVTTESLLREIDHLLEQPPPRRGSPEPSRPSSSRRTLLKNRFPRVSTTTPPRQPPDLWYPTCHRPLHYQRSSVGGVSQQQSEQWDEYTCARSCGFFEYRHRTRKVRRAPSSGY